MNLEQPYNHAIYQQQNMNMFGAQQFYTINPPENLQNYPMLPGSPRNNFGGYPYNPLNLTHGELLDTTLQSPYGYNKPFGYADY